MRKERRRTRGPEKLEKERKKATAKGTRKGEKRKGESQIQMGEYEGKEKKYKREEVSGIE